MDHKTTHTAILSRQVQISKEDILRGFYMLHAQAQEPSQRIGTPNNVQGGCEVDDTMAATFMSRVVPLTNRYEQLRAHVSVTVML
jgi:hypothetical protein